MSCIDGLRLISILDSSTFEEAQSSCVLAVPTTREKFSRIQDIATTEGRNFWIGLNDPIGQIVGSNSDTTRFLNSIDSRLNPFTAGEAGLFPWGAGRPDNGINGEDCVAVTDTGTLDDRNCNSQLGLICEEFCEDPPSVIFEEECLDGVQFFFNPEARSFEGALVSCIQVSRQATLAIPKNKSLLDRINVLCPNSNCWLGLVDFVDEGGSNPSRFISLENELLPFVDIPGSFPWEDGKPDDTNDAQNCAVSNGRGRLDDDFCSAQITSVCQLSCVNFVNNEILSLVSFVSVASGLVLLLVFHLLLIWMYRRQLKHVNSVIKASDSYMLR